MGRLENCYNIHDLRAVAKKRLPRGVFEFVDRGVEDEVALRNNRDAFGRIKLWNQVLVDVDGVTLGTTLFGKPMGLPLAISPTGLAGLCWYEGELALAKAAAKAGIPCTLANGSITPMERLAKEAGGRLWFQIYMWRNRELTYNVVRRARDNGFEALVVTVDTGLGGNREHNRRNGFGIPFKFTRKNLPDFMFHPSWVMRVILPYMINYGMPKHGNYPEGYQDIIARRGTIHKDKAMRGENTTWDDVDKLRKLWPGPLILKGISKADDARQAVERGADAVVVSNHGGRSMDSAPATLDALAGVVSEVGSKTTVLLDSGIRRGGDIVKALALGAKTVMMGRPTLYGVAAGGEEGASHALSLLRAEFRQTMGYVGRLNVADLGPDILAPTPG